MVAGESPDHRAPRGARSPRSVNEQQRRRLPRAVVDHVHSVRVLNVVITHAGDDTELPAISLGQMSAPPRAAPNQPDTGGVPGSPPWRSLLRRVGPWSVSVSPVSPGGPHLRSSPRSTKPMT